MNKNGEILTESITIAKTFNSYSESVTDSLQSNISYESFSKHPSTIKIKQKFKLNKKLSFQCVSEATVRKVKKKLPSNKATTGEILVNVLKIVKFAFLI